MIGLNTFIYFNLINIDQTIDLKLRKINNIYLKQKIDESFCFLMLLIINEQLLSKTS